MDELKLIDIISNILKNNFKKIIKVNVVILFFSFLIYLLLPKKFYAEMSITQSTEADSFGSSAQSLASSVGIDLSSAAGGDVFYIPNIVLSHTTIKNILLKERTIENDLQNLHQFWSDNSLKNFFISQDKLFYESIETFEDRITIEEDFKSGMITVGFYSFSEELSKEILDDLISYINNFINEISSNKSASLSLLYNDKLNSFKNDLTAAENDLKNFAEKNKSFQSSPELLIEYERLQREVMLQNDRYLNVFVQNTLTEIEQEKSIPKLNIISAPLSNPNIYKPSLLLITFFLFMFINTLFLIIAIKDLDYK